MGLISQFFVRSVHDRRVEEARRCGGAGASSVSKACPQASEKGGEKKRRDNLSLSLICSLVRLSVLRNLDAFRNGHKPYVASCKWDKSRGG